jgi:hypothetical protein
LDVLGHVAKVVLFLGGRYYKNVFGLPDQSQSSLNFLATRVIHARRPREWIEANMIAGHTKHKAPAARRGSVKNEAKTALNSAKWCD